ncbi:MAG: methyltransferase domain-containing protein, partial [Ignavibacteria bacterium]|nr:methyltransferase domain-containing protein [Ignavibacteria bacterium]
VFEHLHEPQAALKKFSAMIKPGGLLAIAVPNFQSIQARVFRCKWFHLDVPRHLYHYSPPVLRTMVTAAGFKVVDVNFFSPEHNWAGISESLLRTGGNGESFVHKAVRKLVVTPFSKPIAWLEAALGRGGTFELYAVKQA